MVFAVIKPSLLGEQVPFFPMVIVKLEGYQKSLRLR
jgi:hypothetical protein